MVMKKVSFRVRTFDKEQFLTFDIDNDADLDEEVLDFLEDEEPKGIVPVIFEDENEEFDTFSYNITDKIHLNELSNQEINAEMVLMVLRGMVLSLIDMSEYRIPLAYLVLHRNYIYIDSDYQVEFICIPLEDMRTEVDINQFLRNFIASLRFDSGEDGGYVARLLTYINSPDGFNMRNLLTLIEELMDEKGIEIPDNDSGDIYVEYQEVEETQPEEMAEDTVEVAGETSALAQDVDSQEEEEKDLDNEVASDEEEDVANPESVEEETDTSSDDTEEDSSNSQEEIEEAPDGLEEAVILEQVDDNSPMEEAQAIISKIKDKVLGGESDSEEGGEKKNKFKTRDTSSSAGVVIQDELDEFLAEKEKEEQDVAHEESSLKIKKNIKVSRASIVKNTQDEVRAAEEAAAEMEPDEEEEVSTSILSQSIEATGLLKGAAVPKVNPYLIRVNTNERIMVTKQNFKIGKASMGVDYTVKGNGAVSRVHAIITNKDGIYYVKDNKSTNHTFVNGKMIEDVDGELLTHDSKIVLGDEEFTFKLR